MFSISRILNKVLRPLPFYPILRRGYKNIVTDEQWARIIMNRETQKIVKNLMPGRLDVLEISGAGWREKEPFKSYKQVSYPEFNICRSALEEKFDLIIAEQVFEHLLYPYRAGKNVYTMLNRGGYFLITTPFLIRIHDLPTDCSRWTETGIKYFLAECGFRLDNIQTGSWGNRACIKANFFKWANYNSIIHSLRNEHDFPVVIWALAKKCE